MACIRFVMAGLVTNHRAAGRSGQLGWYMVAATAGSGSLGRTLVNPHPVLAVEALRLLRRRFWQLLSGGLLAWLLGFSRLLVIQTLSVTQRAGIPVF